MSKFLDKVGLQRFLDKLKTLFISNNAANTTGSNFSLTCNIDEPDTQFKTSVSNKGIIQTERIDNYIVDISSGMIFVGINDGTTSYKSNGVVIYPDQIMINIDYGIDSNGTLYCDKINVGSNTMLNLNPDNGISYVLGDNGISVISGEVNFISKYDNSGNVEGKSHPYIDDIFGFTSGDDTSDFVLTYFGKDALVVGVESTRTEITKDYVISPKIAIGSVVNGNLKITGNANDCLMADGSLSSPITNSEINSIINKLI